MIERKPHSEHFIAVKKTVKFGKIMYFLQIFTSFRNTWQNCLITANLKEKTYFYRELFYGIFLAA